MTADAILRRVSEARRVTVQRLRGPSRVSAVVKARHEVMFLLRTLLLMSYPDIAKELGRRDHSCAWHGVANVQENITPLYLSELHSMLNLQFEYVALRLATGL